ncbi:MAG: TetR/AcrR family transcriptional regulator, partial [Candidatus Muiribacteriota bacterium]
SMLASELGMSKANFYTYFPDKETLLFEMIMNKKQEILENASKVIAPEVDPVQKLRVFIKGGVNSYIHNRNYWMVFMEIMINKLIKDKEKLYRLSTFRKNILNLLASIYSELYEKKFFNTYIDVNRLSIYTFGVLHSVMMDIEIMLRGKDFTQIDDFCEIHEDFSKFEVTDENIEKTKKVADEICEDLCKILINGLKHKEDRV